MQRLGILVGMVVVVSACGPAVPNTPTKGISNSAEAAKATAKARDAMSSMSQRSSRQFGLSATTEYNGTCTTSGTVKIKSTASIGALGGGGAGINATLTATADQCFKQNDFKISGQLIYSYTAGTSTTSGDTTSITGELKMDGRVSLETFTSTGEVDQSGVIEYNDLVVKYTVSYGTTNGTFNYNYEVTTSGTFTVGGQVYNPTNEEWGATLSGMGSITGLN
jgi:hypothetical protein